MVDISMRGIRGYTIIELMVVMIVIAIMATYLAAFVPSTQIRARDADRRSDVNTIALYFEQRYNENAAAQYPTYPSTTSLTSDIAPLANGGQRNAVYAPGTSTQSVSAAVSNGDVSGSTTTSTYIYQPFKSDGTLCTASSSAQPCVRFKIWFRLEENSPPATVIDSRHQQ